MRWGLLLVYRAVEKKNKCISCLENRERCICALTQYTPTFKELSQEELHEITTISFLKSFQKDEIIFFENQVCKYLYLLLKGKVKVYKVGNSKELILRILEAPVIFAEAPVFDRIHYFNASAAAMEDSEVLMIDKEKFRELTMKNPKLIESILELFGSRVRQLDEQLEYMNLKTVEARLANYLLELKPINHDDPSLVKFPISKTTLASVLGTVIETLSRTLKSFKKDGLIVEEDESIKIVDYEKLEELAHK